MFPVNFILRSLSGAPLTWAMVCAFFFPEDGVGLVPKRGCLPYASTLRIPQMI
jgi:hypothetical protein